MIAGQLLIGPAAGRALAGRVLAGCLVAACLLAACERPADQPAARDAETAVERSDAPATAGKGRIVFLGTSLTAGLGLDPDQAYPALIQRKIDSAGLPYVAVNAGVSGETSAGARRRIDWLLQEPAAVLVIETGANDMLRGQDVDSLRGNIEAIIARAERQVPKPQIVLIGMQSVPNYGADYARRFASVYRGVAKEHGLVLVPFLLEGVAGIDSLNQTDQMHPTAAGQQVIAETVWRVLAPVLQPRG